MERLDEYLLTVSAEFLAVLYEGIVPLALMRSPFPDGIESAAEQLLASVFDGLDAT